MRRTMHMGYRQGVHLKLAQSENPHRSPRNEVFCSCIEVSGRLERLASFQGGRGNDSPGMVFIYFFIFYCVSIFLTLLIVTQVKRKVRKWLGRPVH